MNNKELIKILQDIEEIAGFREKEILNNIAKIELMQNDQVYKVIRLTGYYGYSFEFEVNSKRITN